MSKLAPSPPTTRRELLQSQEAALGGELLDIIGFLRQGWRERLVGWCGWLDWLGGLVAC